jgi:hypothetical protein
MVLGLLLPPLPPPLPLVTRAKFFDTVGARLCLRRRRMDQPATSSRLRICASRIRGSAVRIPGCL